MEFRTQYVPSSSYKTLNHYKAMAVSPTLQSLTNHLRNLPKLSLRNNVAPRRTTLSTWNQFLAPFSSRTLQSQTNLYQSILLFTRPTTPFPLGRPGPLQPSSSSTTGAAPLQHSPISLPSSRRSGGTNLELSIQP